MKNLILASNSPRRKELMGLFGWPFKVIPGDVDESRQAGEKPQAYVRRLACEKAQKVAEHEEGLIIAADTIVVDGEELLGKPVDKEDARRMLKQLRGRTHQVYTGIALIDTDSGESYDDICRTDVPMRQYSDDEIEAYLATGDPMDKAGAYAIQHPGFHPVDGLRGCYASVMGLPICHLVRGFWNFGLEVPENLPELCEAYLDYRCPIFTDLLGRE